MWAEAQKESFSRVVSFQSVAATPPTETDPRAVMREGGSGIRLDEGRFILAPSSWEVTSSCTSGKGREFWRCSCLFLLVDPTRC